MVVVPGWLEDWLKQVGAWNFVLYVLIFAALVWTVDRFIRRGWPAVKRFVNALVHFVQIVDAVAGLPDFIARTDKSVGEIHHEVHFNNGSSVKDSAARTEAAVGRIEVGVKGLYPRVDRLETDVKELRQADVQMRADFDDTHPKHSE